MSANFPLRAGSLGVFRRALLARRLRLVTVALASCVLAPAEELDLALPPPPATQSNTPVARNVLSPVESIVAATRPILRYSYVDVEGLLAAPGAPTDSSVQSVSLMFTAEIAQSIMLRYTPAWIAYSNDLFDDTFAHNALLQAELALTEWKMKASHAYARAAVPLIETGRQTTVQSHITSVHATRRLREKISLDLGVRQNLRLVKEFAGYHEWATDNSLDYRFSSVITTSGTFSYGYVDVDEAPNMSYQRYGARLRWQPVRAAALDVRGGFESRKTSRSAAGRTDTPIYGATLEYRPTDTTTATLAGDRQLTPSFFQNQLVRTNTWRFGVNQRFFGRFFLSLDWMRRNRSYWATHLDLPTQREDRGRVFRSSLSTTFRTRGTIAVFYQDSRNRSSSQDFDLEGRQIGAEFEYRF